MVFTRALRIYILVFCFGLAGTGLRAQNVITIGDVNTANSSERYPFNGFYNYSWSSVIYLSSEIGQGGQISQVAFNLANTPSNYTMTNQKIYVKHTTATSYTNSTYPGTSGFTLVYDGSITYNSSGWKTITLTTPFTYNGTDNLEFLFESRDGSWANGFPLFKYTAGYSVNRTKRDFYDVSFPSTCQSCAALANVLNIQLTIACTSTLSVSPTTVSICNGSSTVLTASGVSSYTWSPATGLNTTTSASVTASPTVTTTYTVTGKDGSNCVQTKTVTVTVNSAPSLTITPSATTICSGGSTTLVASGGSTYTWSPSTGLNTTSGATVTATPTTTTTYTVSSTGANGCTGNKTVVVTVNGNPSVSVSPTSTTVCNGVGVSLTASGATTYSWSPSTGLNATTGATVTATPAASTTYTVTGTTSGCAGTASTTVTVGNVNAGTATAGGGTVICNNSQVSLAVTGTKTTTVGTGTVTTEKYPFDGFYNYSWSDAIYLQSELGTAGTINKLSFYVDNAPSNYTMNNQLIYVKHTSATGFSGTGYPGTSGFTQVFSGTITYNGSGWKTITFTTPFSYDGTSNLEVLFENRDGSWANGYPLFRYTTGYGTSRVRRDFDDASFPSSCVNCGSFTNLPNTQFTIDRTLSTFVKWQSSVDNSTYTDLAGGTTQSFTTNVNTSTYFRAQFSNGSCTDYSDPAYYLTNNNYYVNDNSTSGDVFATAVGNSGNDGRSPSKPKTSINAIITTYTLGPCDTIFVDKGTYAEEVDIFFGDGGNSNGHTVIYGAGIDVSVLTAPAGKDNIYLGQPNYIKVERFTMNSTQSGHPNIEMVEAENNIIKGNKITHSAAMNIQVFGDALDANGNQILNNTITNSSTTGYGILVWGNADNITVQSNTVTMSNASSVDAILVTTYSTVTNVYYPAVGTISNNIISAYSYGVSLYGFDYPIATYTISNNIITMQAKTTTDGAPIWLGYVGASAADQSIIYNNRLIGGKNGMYFASSADNTKTYNNYISNNDYGVYVAGASSDIGELYFNSFYNQVTNLFFTSTSNGFWKVKNNILYTTNSTASNACISVGSGVTFVACDYNLYYAPSGASVARFNSTNYSTLTTWKNIDHADETAKGDEHSVNGDPAYVNASTNILDIPGGSAAAFKGITLSGIAVDIYGLARTSTPSIGADEPSEATFYFRSIQNGNWNQLSTWQASPDNTNWIAANIIPSYTQLSILVQSTHTVTITQSTTIDEVTVDGTLIYGNNVGSTITVYEGAGTDLIINGIFQDIGPNTIGWNSGATWKFGSAGTLYRTTGTSSDVWRDHYDGGISTIPATANWVIRKTGTDNPLLSSTGGMYYPNLTIDNTTGSTWTTSGNSNFTGSSDYPRVKGNLTIGGTGANHVTFTIDNTNATPVLIQGTLLIKDGSTLQNNGTGLELQGNVNLVGTLTYSNTPKIVFSGSSAQTFTVGGVANMYSLQMNKTSNSLTLVNPLSIDNSLILTKGNIITTSANLLIIKNGATATGGGYGSFISGPIQKIGNSAFTFQTGRGNNYKPIGISAPANATDAITGEYFNVGQSFGTAIDSTLDSLSTCEYWDLNQPVGTSTISITLNWDTLSCNADSVNHMRIAHWNGSKWVSMGVGGSSGNQKLGYNTTLPIGPIIGHYTWIHFNFCILLPLHANAGLDRSIFPGTHPVLGGAVPLGGPLPTAFGGFSPYTYLWTPSSGSLSNSGPNPTLTPGTLPITVNLKITDAIGCTAIDQVILSLSAYPYILLKRELDDIYYDAPNKKLNFKYDEEYLAANSANTNTLDYKIYDKNRAVIFSSTSSGGSLGLLYKDNRYTLDFQTLYPGILPGYYILEVKDRKGQPFYLRFKI